MALDGGFVKKLTAELNEAVDCHIDKVYQPSRDELVFLLRKKGFAKRLLMSARPSAARVNFTESKPENPAVPPNFCMLLRKHFSGAKIIAVTQPKTERIIEFSFEATNEMGDRVNLKIICELIGNQSNIIMLGADGRIIDAVRRSDIETAKRLILPGAKYEYPEAQPKRDITLTDEAEIVSLVRNQNEMPLSKALLAVCDGLSPLICRELCHRAFGNDILTTEIADDEPLYREIKLLADALKNGGKPIMLTDENSVPKDFSFYPITQYGNLYKIAEFEDYSSLLDAFYGERDSLSRIAKASGELNRLVNNLLARANKRLNLRLKELEECKNREHLRIYGELIKANLYLIPSGVPCVRVPNFYDENMAEIEIPLDVALTPQNNAAKYFKEYKKSYTAEQSLTELTKKDREEISYLETVSQGLSRCKNSADIAQIKEELTISGYIKNRNQNVKRKSPAPTIEEHISPDGFKVLVGKNNMQNDYLTTKLSDKTDMWFHTKEIHGSHVVVKCGGEEPPQSTILFAALLAAKNSKASASSNVPVDYTMIKYVKKPSGAKPGMVIYTTNKTVFVNPNEE
ncbi:MAG: NFACT family protein [Clostridia bacterium]|nr:NFACT family protein [Clostridia bacterium]